MTCRQISVKCFTIKVIIVKGLSRLVWPWYSTTTYSNSMSPTSSAPPAASTSMEEYNLLGVFSAMCSYLDWELTVDSGPSKRTLQIHKRHILCTLWRCAHCWGRDSIMLRAVLTAGLYHASSRLSKRTLQICKRHILLTLWRWYLDWELTVDSGTLSCFEWAIKRTLQICKRHGSSLLTVGLYRASSRPWTLQIRKRHILLTLWRWYLDWELTVNSRTLSCFKQAVKKDFTNLQETNPLYPVEMVPGLGAHCWQRDSIALWAGCQ